MSWLGMFSTPWLAYAVAGGAVLAATTITGQGAVIWHRGNVIEELREDVQTEKTGRLADRSVATEIARQQEAKHRRIEQERATAYQEIADEGQRWKEAAMAAGVERDAARRRLRDTSTALAAAASRAAESAVAPRECAPVAAAANLLADVLGRLEEAGAAVVGHADEAHTRGLRCERAHAALTGVTP